MSKFRKLQEQRSQKLAALRTLQTDGESRALTTDEETQFSQLTDDITALDAKIDVEARAMQLLADEVKDESEKEGRKLGDQEARAAYRAYIAGDLSALSGEQRAYIEQRSSLSGLSGTVLVPDQMASSIETALEDFGGMFEAADTIITSKGDDLILPTVNDTTRKSTIVTAYGQSNKDKPVFSSVTLKAYTYRTPIVPISEELLQDSAFDVESTVAGLLSDSHARALNYDFTNGTGTDQPKGIVTAATPCTNKAESDSITFDDIIHLISSPNGAYQKKGKLMFNTNTMWAIASLVDKQGRPLVNSMMIQGVPPTVLGKQFIINDDMPDIGSGNASMLFGDLSKYKIRMVKGYTTKRFNENLGEWLSIGLMGYGRADGTLLDAGTHPVYKLVHATATQES